MADSSATQIQESADKLTGVLNELVANKDKMQPIITYCSDAYAQLPHTATQERDGIQAATRDYISDALLNAAYQIHCAATQFNELFNLQLDQLSQIEAKLAVANTVRAPPLRLRPRPSHLLYPMCRWLVYSLGCLFLLRSAFVRRKSTARRRPSSGRWAPAPRPSRRRPSLVRAANLHHHDNNARWIARH